MISDEKLDFLLVFLHPLDANRYVILSHEDLTYLWPP